MKRNYIIPAMASLLMLGACDYNEDNFEGLDEMTRPTNVFKKDYTLTDADYATIANNSTNKALAEAAGLSGELSALKTSLTFTDELPGTEYIPAFWQLPGIQGMTVLQSRLLITSGEHLLLRRKRLMQPLSIVSAMRTMKRHGRVPRIPSLLPQKVLPSMCRVS